VRKIIAILLLITAAFNVAFAKDNLLKSVKVIPLPEDRVRIDFHFSQPLKQLPASFITQKPARIVLDFIDTKMELDPEQKTQQINLGSLKNYSVVAVGDRVRTILDLERTVSYSGSTAGSIYSLILNGKSNELFERNKSVFITHQNVNAKHELKHLDFRGIDKQGGRILIDTSDASIPIDVTQHGKELVVSFLNTKIPPSLMKHFDVADFHSPVQEITLQQDAKNVRMTVLNKGDYGHYVYQVNKQFMVDVFPLTEEEIKQQKQKKHVFTGKRISLNFQSINIRAVLQLLADFTGINMVISGDINKDITLKLDNVPWDQALDVILTTQGLDKRQAGNVMLIDTKDNLSKQEESQLKNKQIIQKLEPIRSELIQINYAKAADLAILIKDRQSSLLSDRGKISVDARTNTLWIQDIGAKIEEVRELIKQLDVPVKQVLIEARIVDVTKDFEKNLGIRWGISRPTHLSGSLEGANGFQTLPGSANPAAVPIADRLNLDLAAAPIAGATPASVGIALARLGDNILLDLELSALESEGRAELISSPRLITTNQQAAVIESGEEIPYQEATSSGATAVAFKKAVLSLKVTPQITPDNRILMDLKINQDRRGPETAGVPSILTKEIQTNVLVNNGQTIVLGGIYRQDKRKDFRRIPFFGSLPVVGPLFGNKRMVANDEELLIFITPRIITHSLAVTAIQGHDKEVYK
jgi:type IV pilus assembly protein PilQ